MEMFVREKSYVHFCQLKHAHFLAIAFMGAIASFGSPSHACIFLLFTLKTSSLRIRLFKFDSPGFETAHHIYMYYVASFTFVPFL